MTQCCCSDIVWLPELYPISYAGNTDYNPDGNVDIDDAVMLFRYSMLPELYPID